MPRPAPTRVTTAGEEHADNQAGWLFRCILRGSVRESDVHQPMLRLYFEDGSSYAVPVPRQAIRLCAGPEELARAVRLFPGLASDPSLDAFAEALAKTAKSQADRIVPIDLQPASRVALFTMPRDRDDLILVLTEIRLACALLPPDVGIALLASRQTARTHIVKGVEQLRSATGRPVSLFGIGEPAYALWSIEAVLAALGAEQFWFCGPDTVPTRDGWKAAAALLGTTRGGLTLFTRAPGAGAAPEPDSLGFVWTRAAFRDWTASAPFFLEGFHRDNLLPAEPPPSRISGAIGLLRSMVGPETLYQADERLYRKARAERGSGALVLLAEAVASPWH